MLFLPSQLSPDSISFDAGLAKDFTWETNGDKQTSYRLKIYLNSTSALVYDSTQITSAVSSHTLPQSTLTNNNEYKWQLEVFAGSSSILSEFIFIKTNTTPVVNVSVPATLTSSTYTFTGSYSQAQNIAYNRYKFTLYDNNNIEISNSGWQYDYNVSYSVDGFIAGNTYKIELIMEARDSLVGTSGKVSFNVNFEPPQVSNAVTITPNNNSGGIELTWTALERIVGSLSGNVEYVTGKFNKGVNVKDLSSITVDKTVPEDHTLTFYIKLESAFTGKFVSLGNNEFVVGYDGVRFYYSISPDNSIYSSNRSLPTDFFKVGLTPDKVIIATSSYTEIF